MKIKPAKIIVPVLAIMAAAATVGSISGTVAWFQYSTRVTAAYQGAAAHCSENLEIRIRSTKTDEWGAWKRDLRVSDITSYLAAGTTDGGAGRTVAGNSLTPVTSGELAQYGVASTLYNNPRYQFPEMSQWGTASATEDYIVLPLELRVLDQDGDTTPDYLAKKIYISDVTISARANHDTYVKADHLDLSPAIRVGVSAGQTGETKVAYTTFATSGSDTVVAGALDLNGDGVNDKEKGYEDWDTLGTLQYGYTSGEAASHVAKATANTMVAADAAATVVGVANDTNSHEIHGKEIGSTTASKNLEVDLLIYLEGWTKLGASGSESAIWDLAKGVGAEFNVGVQFTCEDHNFGE